MQCLTTCPKKCLSANPAPAVAGTAAAIMTCGLVQIGTLTVPKESAALSAYGLDQTGQGSYTDGVYTGVGTGFRGDTEVQVTVAQGYITDITVLSYEDDPEFFQKAQSSILGQILSQQSTDVPTVSGATYSSRSILHAVANALGLEAQSESDGAGLPNDQQGEPNWAPSTDPNPSSTDFADSTPSTLDLSSLADGPYQGEGQGVRGPTSVSVTVENGKITDITIVSYQDDAQFFSRAQNTIIQEIINTQSLDVSCVSGATFSSNGILEAVANALNVSFDNPNASSSNQGGHTGGHDNFRKPRH